jgi:hypothetical protein
MTEVLRQSAHVSKRLVAIVEEGYLPHIEDKWQRLPRELRSLESFLKDSTGQIEEETGFKVFNYERKINTQETWLEFIEKQVILDVLMEPYIYSNFVRYQAFPYDPEGFMGKETALLNVFTFWEHYQQKYVKKLKGAAILEEEFDKYMMEEGYENK